MKGFVQNIYLNPKNAKTIEWLKLVSVTGGAQIGVQISALVCGILIIRLLPTHEYALYTLANAMLGTMTLLSDGGISTGVMSQGGKVWRDKEKLGIVMSTGLDLRRKFAIVSLILVVPILFYLLIHNNATPLTSFLIVISLIPTFFSALSDSLLEIVPKLHQDIPSLQKNQLYVSVGRLALSAISVFVFPWAFIAILAAGVPRMLGNISLRRIVRKFVSNESGSVDKHVQFEILKVVRRSLPELIYYCVSGQITIWLISIFGNSSTLAEVGAISRLSMLLNVVTVGFSMLIIPRFARLEFDKRMLTKRFLQIIAASFAICLVIEVLVILFTEPILYVLGSKYANLQYELILYMIGSCLSMIVGICFGLYASRGWIMSPALNITFNVALLISCISIFNVSTFMGVLWLNISIALGQFVLHFSFFLYKIRSSS